MRFKEIEPGSGQYLLSLRDAQGNPISDVAFRGVMDDLLKAYFAMDGRPEPITSQENDSLVPLAQVNGCFYSLKTDSREILCDGLSVSQLTVTRAEVLTVLAYYTDQFVDKALLLQQVWGEEVGERLTNKQSSKLGQLIGSLRLDLQAVCGELEQHLVDMRGGYSWRAVTPSNQAENMV